MEKEIRNFKLLEIREDGGDKIRGTAIVFDKLSEDLGGFREKIDSKAIENMSGDILALWQHDTALPIARTGNGSLKLELTKNGLDFEMSKSDTTWSRDAFTAIREGLVNQMSFGFVVDKDTWVEEKDKTPIRTINKLSLHEISPVTWPAYEQTSVSVRDRLKAVEEKTIENKPVKVPIIRMKRARSLDLAEKELI